MNKIDWRDCAAKHCEYFTPTCGLDDTAQYICYRPEAQVEIKTLDTCPERREPTLDEIVDSIQRNYTVLLGMERPDSRRRGINTAIIMSIMGWWEEMYPILKGFKLTETDKWQLLLEARDKEIADLRGQLDASQTISDRLQQLVIEITSDPTFDHTNYGHDTQLEIRWAREVITEINSEK